MLKEFKDFALKGNLVDMAVGFVMGGAFATVVTAFIQGVFLPLLAPIMGGIDLSSIAYTITPEVVDEAGEVVKPAAIVELGNFISAIISFVIVAFVMFLIIKGMNGAIGAKTVTYDFERLMEGATLRKCSEFGDDVISHMN